MSADNGGLGAVIINEFERRGWPLNRINFGDDAHNPDWYGNVRAEMYFELSNRIKRDEVRLPDDQQLKDQLGWQKYLPSDGPLKLIAKKDMPGSPDRGDTVAMLYYDMPAADQYHERQEQIEKALSKTMVPQDAEGYRWTPEESATGLW